MSERKSYHTYSKKAFYEREKKYLREKVFTPIAKIIIFETKKKF